MDHLRYLLKKGVNVNADLSGRHGSALSAAAHAFQDSEAKVRLLLNAGATCKAHLKSAYGSALAAAAAGHSVDTMQLLLDNGAEVDTPLSGNFSSALAAAATGGAIFADAIRLLLENGADINAHHGRRYATALAAAVGAESDYGAIKIPKADKVLLLLENGANINIRFAGKYGSALAVAIIEGGAEIVQLLLDHGADLDILNDKLQSIFHFAAQASLEVLELLLRQVHAKSRAAAVEQYVDSHTAFEISTPSETDSPPLGTCLASLVGPDGEGRTPFHFAALSPISEKMKILKLFLDNGLPISSLDHLGRSPFHYAIMSDSDYEVVEFLLHPNTNLSRMSRFWTPLQWACARCSLDVVELLLKRGALPDVAQTQEPDRIWRPVLLATYFDNPYIRTRKELEKLRILVNAYTPAADRDCISNPATDDFIQGPLARWWGWRTVRCSGCSCRVSRSF